MKAELNESEYLKIKSFSEDVFSNKVNFEYLISEDTQLMEIKKLHLGLRKEQFFIIIDLLNFRIINHGGLEEFGYDHRKFSLKTYFQMISSEGISTLLTILGKQTFLLSKSDLIGFLKPSFVVQLPMKLKNGDDSYFLIKRSISPWQITKCGQITAYLSEFTIIKPYNFEALNPRIDGIPDDYKEEFMKAFYFNFKQSSLNENPFSPKEMLIMEELLKPKDPQKKITEILNIKPNTLNSYNKAILEKARQMFGEKIPVKTASDVATYLKNNGLLK